MQIVFTFPSTAAVICAEQILLANGVEVKVRPIPTAIRAGCGLSLCIDPDDTQRVKDMLANAVEYEHIYISENGAFTLVE